MAEATFHSRYELLQVLGSGACGSVFSAAPTRARPASAGAVAVKVLDLRREAQQRVLEEVEMMQATAQSGRCARLVEAFFEGGLAYIVMERCDRPLSVALACQPRLHERALASFLRQSMHAVAAIHAAGVVHRDIKPDSFMCCGAEDAVKLVDFGLATWAPRGGERLFGTCGTPPFMAPEMLQGDGYGAEVDVWSLGVMAYVLLLGQFPYTPAHMTSKSMKEAIRTGTPAPSFRPADNGARPMAHAGASISDDAVGLLRLLLQRDVPSRPTAEQALELHWMRCEKSTWRQWRHASTGPCLKWSLMAAADLHAFDPAPVLQAKVEVDAEAEEAEGEVRCGSFLAKVLNLARRKLAPPPQPRMACDEGAGAEKLGPPVPSRPRICGIIASM